MLRFSHTCMRYVRKGMARQRWIHAFGVPVRKLAVPFRGQRAANASCEGAQARTMLQGRRGPLRATQEGRDGEHQGLAFVPCTTNSELRMGAEDALIFRFPTWSGSSRSTHARRKRRVNEGLAGTLCEPTTSMQTRLWRGWRGKEFAAGPLRC